MKRLIRTAFPVIVLAVLLFLVLVVLTRAQTSDIVATGGQYVLEKAALAGGGNEKGQVAVIEHGTSAQTIAGIQSAGGVYSIYSGFWTPDSFTPTAAGVIVGGRITTQRGKGIRNVSVTITYPSGEIRSTLSGSLGYYKFDDIPAGETYVISVSARQYIFSEPSLVRHIVEEVTDVNFIAEPAI